MGRSATGTIQWRGESWWARVTMTDKTRPWIEMPGIPRHDEDQARAVAAVMAKRARSNGVVPTVRDETVNEYMTRWVAWRRSRGMTSAGTDLKVIRKHFAQKHGHMPLSLIGKALLEDFVTALDAKVSREEMSWKSANNTWGSVSSMFRDAATAKDRTYRALEANPALGVARPDRGVKRVKTYLYPSEFLELMACASGPMGVPLVRRRLYAATTYLKLRAGEIEALEWSDVDLSHGIVLVHLAVDRSEATKKTKSTKSEKSRRVRIEPELLPLLVAMKREATTVHVFPVMPTRSGNNGYAKVLRADLLRAGCTRAELYETSPTRKSMTFHDLRATGLTWMAVRGDDALKIQATAGHSTFGTTQGYIREAEIHRSGFGAVFPALPSELIGSVQVASAIVFEAPRNPKNLDVSAPTVGLEPTSDKRESATNRDETARDASKNRPLGGSSPLEVGSWSDFPVFAGETGDDLERP